jgi:hypothetical protein
MAEVPGRAGFVLQAGVGGAIAAWPGPDRPRAKKRPGQGARNAPINESGLLMAPLADGHAADVQSASDLGLREMAGVDQPAGFDPASSDGSEDGGRIRRTRRAGRPDLPTFGRRISTNVAARSEKLPINGGAPGGGRWPCPRRYRLPRYRLPWELRLSRNS